ncbi:thiol:disulfide interchange protein [Ventosimonas gracilis]|uniref:Thiol:disulfide interchange protein n=1 Tax=Ventosimonas gracilis TaxID=1680762 RepID=A0A139SY20_9GAMM|nr:DsbE family thiol:disulfide interchange protein [Ventosimonas gracilis]KXU39493.1 thiol:disulfide interchange protein [Ventosimonas gracilis]
MKRLLLLAPLLLFIALALLLWRGLYLDPSELPSPLIGKPVPKFSLPQVTDETLLTQEDLKGQPALLNVWATWCIACRVEHPQLNQLAQQGVRIIGVNYKDDNADAVRWLQEFHNPYQLNIRDENGTLGLDLGVYGAPETFFIDSQGIIRHKYIGVIDMNIWQQQLAPLYQKLLDEAAP